MEALVPLRVLRVGDDARAGECGRGNGDGDVGVAGDDLPVVVQLPVVAAAGLAAAAGVDFAVGGGSAGGEAAAEALGEEVHVGERARLEDVELQISVQVDNRRVVRRHD